MSTTRFAAVLLGVLLPVVFGSRTVGASGPRADTTAARYVTLYRVLNGTAREPLVPDSGLDVPIGSERFQKLFPHRVPEEHAGRWHGTIPVRVGELPFRRDGRPLLRIEGTLPNACVRPTVVVIPAASVPGYRVIVRAQAHPGACIQVATPFTLVLELPRWVKPGGRRPAPSR